MKLKNTLSPTPIKLARLLVIALTLLTPSALSQADILKGTASDGGWGQCFGSSVSVLANQVVVGAPFANGPALSSGAVYVLSLPYGEELFRLVASDGQSGDRFGHSVAMDSAWVLVGAPGGGVGGSGTGAVYVFDRSTGIEVGKLVAPVMNQGDQYGTSIALTSGIAIVGAPRVDGSVVDSGAAYAWDVATLTLLAKLTASDEKPGAEFGNCVAIDGTTVVAGAHLKGSNQGAAYVFDSNAWVELHMLESTDAALNGHFGTAVAVLGNRVVVGAPTKSVKGMTEAGRIYLFDTVTGLQIGARTSNATAEYAHFGEALAVSGNRLVVGASRQPATGPATAEVGAVFILDATSLKDLYEIRAQDAAEDDFFGRSVAIDGQRIVAGSSGDDDDGLDSGSIYVLDDTSQQVGTTYCWTWPNSTGLVAEVHAFGSTLVSVNALQLRCYYLPPGQYGYLVNSSLQGFQAFPGGSQGNICLGGLIGRHINQVLSTGSGYVEIMIDATSLARPGGPYAILPGETWNWQFWYRDFNQNPTSNFTYGVSVTFQ